MKLTVVVLLATLMQGIQSQSGVVDCGHPGNITNGRVDVSQGTLLRNIIFYRCDVGYYLNGSSLRLCLPDGSWSGRDPTCEAIKICPDLEDIDHGSVVVIDRIAGRIYASIGCDPGYKLNGSSIRECDVSRGQWIGPAPTCEESNVDCGHPGNVTNGTVDVSEGTKLDARVYYMCNRGYRINGSVSRICGSDGQWTSRDPTCEVPTTCPDLEDIDNGSVELTRLSTFYYASYICDVGFERRGTQRRDCNIFTGEWDGTAPTCEESNVDCGHPGNIQYGTVNVSEGTKLHARIHYTCDEGYGLNGRSFRTCEFNSQWSGSAPTCQGCELPGDPEHGKAHVSGTTRGSQVNYTCDRGYRINGTSSRTCGPDGTWGGREPTCEDCGHPGNITNSKVILDNGTKIGPTVYYMCDEGYRLNGPSYRTCGQYGWSGLEPSCVVECGHPGNISNGIVRIFGSTFRHNIHYSCDVGYFLNGTSWRILSLRIHSWRICQSNGTWSGNKPTCEAMKKCPNPEDIDHGSVTVVDRIRYFRELYARYSCDRGHALRGQSRRNCDLFTGEWEGPAPTCEESSVNCGHPGNVTNGTVDISEGTNRGATARYTCDEEFIRNGSWSRRCGSDGRWSGTAPTCEAPKTCPQLDIEHGSVKVDRFPTMHTAFYTCDVGYEMGQLRVYRECDLFTGEWDRTAPTCKESNVDCGHPGNITNGIVNVSEGTKIHARIYYTCDRGYGLYGIWSNRYCQSDGTWSDEEPTCGVPECEHPGNITNGEVTFYGGTIIRHGIIYSCDEGYILNGISTRLCMIGGSWSGSEPTCEAIKRCPNPEDIDHGSMTVFRSYALYSCDRGHTMRGQSRRHCDLFTGEWEGPAPTCEQAIVDCGHPGNIHNGTVDVSGGTELDATVQYTCDEGFSRNGSSTRTCQSDGRWSGTTPTCEAIDCGHPGEITNGRVNVSRGTKLGARVRYSCNRGYKLKGPSTRKCKKTGLWNKKVPICKKRN